MIAPKNTIDDLISRISSSGMSEREMVSEDIITLSPSRRHLKPRCVKIFNPLSICKKLLFASSYDSAGCRRLYLLYLHFIPFSFPFHTFLYNAIRFDIIMISLYHNIQEVIIHGRKNSPIIVHNRIKLNILLSLLLML